MIYDVYSRPAITASKGQGETNSTAADCRRATLFGINSKAKGGPVKPKNLLWKPS